MSLKKLGEYKNTFVVITGANAGIGFELTQFYIKQNIQVLAIDLSISNLHHPNISAMELDVASDEAWIKIAEHEYLTAAALKVRPLLHWYNNAGVSGLGLGLEQTEEEVQKIFKINFWAVLRGTKLAIKTIETQKSKHPNAVINISSMSAYIPAPMMSAYSATKAAVRNYTLSLQEEVPGIPLHVVTPGFVKTKILESHATLRLPDWMMKRASDPTDTAQAIIESVLRGEREIIPDPNGRNLYKLWRLGPSLSRKISHYLLK